MSEICAQLHQLFHSLDVHSFPIDFSNIPNNGIYLLFEKGEIGHGGKRIVRIGTHTGNDQLKSRIQQHFLNEVKDRSIFRKNVGRALLNRSNDPFLAQWDLDLTTREAKQKYSLIVDTDKQQKVEQQVTSYMRSHFSFVVFEVKSKQLRLDWESKIISTISLCQDCCASPNWLGLHSPKEKIRESGLWLVNELYKQPFDLVSFSQLAQHIQQQKFLG